MLPSHTHNTKTQAEVGPCSPVQRLGFTTRPQLQRAQRLHAQAPTVAPEVGLLGLVQHLIRHTQVLDCVAANVGLGHAPEAVAILVASRAGASAGVRRAWTGGGRWQASRPEDTLLSADRGRAAATFPDTEALLLLMVLLQDDSPASTLCTRLSLLPSQGRLDCTSCRQHSAVLGANRPLTCR